MGYYRPKLVGWDAYRELFLRKKKEVVQLGKDHLVGGVGPGVDRETRNQQPLVPGLWKWDGRKFKIIEINGALASTDALRADHHER